MSRRGNAYGYQHSFNDNLAQSFNSILVPFTPLDISGLVLWLDGSDINTITKNSNNRVTPWSDKTPAGNNAIQATEPARPFYKPKGLNQNSVINFQGGQRFILPSALYSLPAGAYTMFFVCRQETAAVFNRIITMTDGGSSRLLLFYSASNGIVSFYNNTTFDSTQITGVTTTNYNIIRARRSGAAQALAVNGGTEIVENKAIDLHTITDIALGAHPSGSDALNGDMADILIYNRSLIASESAKVEQYLSQKWGIAAA